MSVLSIPMRLFCNVASILCSLAKRLLPIPNVSAMREEGSRNVGDPSAAPETRKESKPKEPPEELYPLW